MPRLTPRRLTVCLALPLTFIAQGTLWAQQTGQLDPNFGVAGKVVLSWNPANQPFEEAMAVASQSDGKMVIAGRSWSASTPVTGLCTVGRTLADGSVDPAFGNNGLVTIDFSPTYGSSYCNAVAIQSDAKILVAGGAQVGPNYESDLVVARLHPDGSLDTSFGSSGKVALSYVSGSGTIEYVEEVLLQSDGKIILAGTFQWAGGSDRDFLALRLLETGSLDTSYGALGYAPVAFDLAASRLDQLFAAAIQNDDRVVLAGFADTSNVRDFAVARLTVNGSLDSTFGNGGKAVIDFHPGQQTADLAYDVMIDSFQRIVLAGESTAPGASNPTFALARLAPSGSLDTSFSTDGRQTVSFPYPQGSRAWAVAQVANNKLVAVGEASYTTTDDDFAAARLLDNGTLDSSFGSQGVALVAFDVGPGKSDLASDLTIQLDGGIVMVGIVEAGTSSSPELDWGLAKLTGEPFLSFP